MKFRVGHSYITTHKDNKKYNPERCIIRVIALVYETNNLYRVTIMKSRKDSQYYIGASVLWYEDWCFDTQVLNKNTRLAYEL